MESMIKFEDVVTHVGVNTALLPFLGDYPTCTIKMSMLNKKIRVHWIEWEDEYKKACLTKRTRIFFHDFSKANAMFLLKNSEYKHYSLSIVIYSDLGFREFTNFLSKVENYDDLKIELFRSFMN